MSGGQSEVASRNRNCDGSAFRHHLDATERNLDRGCVVARFDGTLGAQEWLELSHNGIVKICVRRYLFADDCRPGMTTRVCCFVAIVERRSSSLLGKLELGRMFGLQAIFSLEFVVYRFVLRENIARFQNVLKVETAESVRHTILGMLLSVKRELAMLESRDFGIQDGPWPLTVTHRCLENNATGVAFRLQFATSPTPYLALDPRPGLHIIDINDAYARATMTRRAAVVGRPIFDVFPDNPDDPRADGVSNLYASLRAAADSRQPNAMPIQRYDIRDADGRFIERYWRQLNTPVFDSEGRLDYLLHHAEDVTELRVT